MALTYEGFLAYARLSDEILAEDPGEALTAELCYKAAVADAKSHGIPVEEVDNAKLELYIYNIALYDFDDRGYAVLDHSAAAVASRQQKMTQTKLELEIEGWSIPALPFEQGGYHGI